MMDNNPESSRGRWGADRESLWEFVSERGMDDILVAVTSGSVSRLPSSR